MKSIRIFLITIALVSSNLAFAADKSLDNELYESMLIQDIPKLKENLAKGGNPNYKAAGRPILCWASQSGNLEIVQILLAAHADVNAADEGLLHTPLMRAIETQQTAIVNELLKAKANPNAKAADGDTILDMAVESRRPEIVSAVIAAGADVGYVSSEGETPALKAAQDGMPESIEIIKILGRAKANVNASNLVYTPLSYSIEQGNVELVSALLEAGADPNKKTNGGRIPLHIADKAEIVELLIKAKADPNVPNESGTPALITAVENGNAEVVAALIKGGADVNRRDSAGNSPLQVANNYSKSDLVELLKKNGASEQ